MLHTEEDVTNAVRPCCNAMSSGMAHFSFKCNKTNYACLPACLPKEPDLRTRLGQIPCITRGRQGTIIDIQEAAERSHEALRLSKYNVQHVGLF